MSTALVLSGGGARGAYQVGVLKGITELLPNDIFNPFPIVCGTSAGAINTLALAGRHGNFKQRVQDLIAMWQTLTADKIYRTDLPGVTKNTLKIFYALFNGGYGLRNPVAFLDNTPLKQLLAGYIQFREVDEAIASGYLKAVAITAMSYSTGQSISFFQGNYDNWQRSRRLGIRTGLTLNHLMASSAIPSMFSPVKIGNHFYGDGALRQLKPLSPALHLGATKLFVIGVTDKAARRQSHHAAYHPPSMAQMIGHMLNGAFIDSIESDLETLRAINDMAEKISQLGASSENETGQKKVDYLCITPSSPIDKLAEGYIKELPWTMRFFLRLTGGTRRGGGTSAASYLLFEPGFCNQLIEMGYKDTLAREKDVLSFFTSSLE